MTQTNSGQFNDNASSLVVSKSVSVGAVLGVNIGLEDLDITDTPLLREH